MWEVWADGIYTRLVWPWSPFLKVFIWDLLGFQNVGRQFACSTACHTNNEASYCTSAIGQKAYSMCCSGSLKLPGFPEFEQVVNGLKTSSSDLPSPEFQVCLPVPNGIAIKQNLVDYWMGSETFQVEMADMLEQHNSKYNKHGTKRGCTETGEGRSVLSLTKFLLY